MKTLFHFISLALISVFMLCSCANVEQHRKENLIGSLSKLVQKVEQQGSSYSDEQWEKAVEQYEKLVEEIDKTDFPDEQLKKIGNLKRRFLTAVSEHEMDSGMKAFHRLLIELEGALE